MERSEAVVANQQPLYVPLCWWLLGNYFVNVSFSKAQAVVRDCTHRQVKDSTSLKISWYYLFLLPAERRLMSMNQNNRIGLDNETVESILKFNERLKGGRLTESIRDVAIDLYCDYLNVMHPECGLLERRN